MPSSSILAKKFIQVIEVQDSNFETDIDDWINSDKIIRVQTIETQQTVQVQTKRFDNRTRRIIVISTVNCWISFNNLSTVGGENCIFIPEGTKESFVIDPRLSSSNQRQLCVIQHS